ncbi:HNH endonuclease signature motif containing protein [Nocardioides sp. R-C-SC26]|uniref:HNH endonuclease signature motif containing protein n=1 Tax=Nocardioides sp. R-C-SC26 TaxID=2870414 RepID=UPI001E329947|nr:HNH endonuclease signature motif containing protein [Nocardioides sp. R-C-SC26]
MTSLTDSPDGSSPLAEAVAAQARVEQSEIDLAVATVGWAEVHRVSPDRPRGFIGGGLDPFDVAVMLAGPGAPGVSEYALVDYATAVGLSHDAGRRYVGDVLEIRHRLPRLWARLTSGGVRVWQARRVAQATLLLSREAAFYVDRQVNLVAGRIGPAQLDSLVARAIDLYEVGDAEDRRLDERDGRRLEIDCRSDLPGRPASTATVVGVLDVADARDVDAAVVRVAADLAACGSTASLDVRRAAALGELARRQTAFDLGGSPHGSVTEDGTIAAAVPRRTRVPARQVVLYVHLHADALVGRASAPRSADLGGAEPTLRRLARVEGAPAHVPVETIAGWCAASGTTVTVRPIIDTGATHVDDAYTPPQRMREQILLRDVTCVFPYCTRTARSGDLDHIEPWHEGGATSTHNLAALCRRHHRAKTHAGWRYRPRDPVTDPGAYVWSSPSGREYRRHADGTTTLVGAVSAPIPVEV